MIRQYIPAALSVALLLATSSCDRPVPVSGGALVEQTAELNHYADGKAALAGPNHVQAALITDPSSTQQRFGVAVTLFKPTQGESTATLQLSSEAAQAYAAAHAAAGYQLLSADQIVLPSDPIHIPAESTQSDAAEITVQLTDDMLPNTPYLFAVELTSLSEQSSIASYARVALFSVERYHEEPTVTKALKISRGNYLELAKGFSSTRTLTMECLVYVEKFRSAADPGDEQISTLMGIEGGTLLRFGDAGIDGNRLQAAGTEVDFTFKENKWYHIAFTSENGSTKVYINGEEKAAYTKQANLIGGNPWYIGRSWNGNRGIQAQMAEVRVWGVARTTAQIRDHMYMVDAKSEGLIGYWKMNESTNDRITDLTGNGYDLLLKSQAEGATKSVNIVKLDEPVDVEN